MNAVLEHSEKGAADIITRMALALVDWVPQHAASMDAGVAQHLQSVAFDTETETRADPSVIRSMTMSGCGSISCS